MLLPDDSQGSLSRHKQSVPEGNKPFPCNICNYKADFKANLRSDEHRMNHYVIMDHSSITSARDSNIQNCRDRDLLETHNLSIVEIETRSRPQFSRLSRPRFLETSQKLSRSRFF